MKTLVILNKTQFFVTVIEGNKDCLNKPGYMCEANGLASDVFDNSSAAIIHYINKDITFHPFNCIYDKFTIFIYGIGASSDDELYYAGPGFKSFICKIGSKKKSTLFVQDIKNNNSTVKIYQDNNLMSTHVGSDPNDVWEKIGYLKNYKSIDWFGINQPQVQSFIQTMHIPKCLPEEWNNVNKMETLWNYYLRKCTLASVQWSEFFIKWQSEKNSVIKITDALKNLYPENHVFGDREIQAWQAMLSHAGCTNITPFSKSVSSVKIQEGNDITFAIENIAGTSVAHIEPNCVKGKEKSTTIPGISNWFEWSWPIEGDNAGYIQACALPNLGNWVSFSPAHIQNFLKNEINQPSPQLSEPTKPKSPWKIAVPNASGIKPKRLLSKELKNELKSQGVEYENQNKRQKLIGMLEEELGHETLVNTEGSHLRNPSMSNEEQEIIPVEVSNFPLTGGWALKEVQKYGKKGGEQCFLAGNIDKGCRMSAQEMLDYLKLKMEEGEIESSDLPKLSTIQEWITRFTAQLCEKSAQATIGVE
ncbi:4742_t:CDS:2, partial [Entrophospora sp. SA101]